MSDAQENSKKARVQELLFDMPLYATSKVTAWAEIMTGLPVDGYCARCKNISTFSIFAASAKENVLFAKCARNQEHVLTFYFRKEDGKFQKIGQYPSYMDLKKDETQGYSKALTDQDRDEFRKAITTAAHGFGIASHVYLRRIFERLIQSRFDEIKDDKGWTDDDFKVHMSDKIKLLKGNIPDILVENWKIYGSLSDGIHQLDEVSCLRQLPVLKKAVLLIIHDDFRRRQERIEREELQKDISELLSGRDRD